MRLRLAGLGEVDHSKRAFLGVFGGFGATTMSPGKRHYEGDDAAGTFADADDPSAIPLGRLALTSLPSPNSLVAALGASEEGGVRIQWFGSTNGNDLGEAINSADAYLGSRPGTLWVRPGGGDFFTGVVLQPHHTLSFGAGLYRNHFNGVLFQVGDDTVIEGSGWNTIIMESDHANGAINADLLAYCVWRPVTFGSAEIAKNITLRHLQVLGNPSALANATAATVISGNAHTATIDDLWLNGTHSIGVQIGAINYGPDQYADAVTVRRCLFSEVGGARPGVEGGGGVSAGITNAQNSVIEDCVFTTPLGNTVIDIEPNVAEDRIINCRVSRNTIQAMNPALHAYCISATNSARAKVSGNQIVDNIMDGTGGPSNMYAVIGIYAAISDTLVSDNVIYNCSNGIAVIPNLKRKDPLPDIVERVTVQHNKIWGTDDNHGIRLKGAQHCRIVGNETDAMIREECVGDDSDPHSCAQGEQCQTEFPDLTDYNLFLSNITPSRICQKGIHSVVIGTVAPL